MAVEVLNADVLDIGASGTAFDLAGHTVDADTETLVVVVTQRRYSSTPPPPVLSAKWKGAAGTALVASANLWGVNYNDISAWVGYLHAPSLGAGALRLESDKTLRGGAVALYDLRGNRTSGDPIGAVAFQGRDGSEPATVSLSIPVSAAGGSLAICTLAVAVETTLAGFTGAGFSAVATGTYSAGDDMTATTRHKAGVSGTVATSATFGAASKSIGGVLLEVLAAPSDTADRDITDAVTVDDGFNAAAGSAAVLASPGFLDGRQSFSVAMLLQADDIGVDRMVVRIGTAAGAILSLARRAAGTVAANVWQASWRLADGSTTVDSAASTQTTSPQHVAVVHSRSSRDEIYLDGVASRSSLTTGGLSGGLAVTAGNELAVGAHSGGTPPGIDGKIGRLMLYDGALSPAQIGLLAASQLDQAGTLGIGSPEAIDDAAPAPVAMPLLLEFDGQAYLDVDPAVVNTGAAAASVTAVTNPSAGSVTVRSNGKLRWTPPVGWVGTDTATYTVTAAGKSSTAQIRATGAARAGVGTFRSGMPWMSGAIFANNPANVRAFETWRGCPVDITITYSGKAFSGTKEEHEATADLQWAKIKNSTNYRSNGFIKQFLDMGIAVCHVHPILVYQETGDWPSIARGDRDADHQVIASQLASWLLPARQADPTYPMLYLCLGQEVNQGSMPWRYTANIGTPAQYVAAHRRICTIFKDTLGAAVKFTWNTLNQSGDISQVFPGARGDVPGGVIDVLTTDNYDNGYDNSYFTRSKAAGFASWLNNGGSGYTRNVQYRCPRNALRWAADHGLKWGIQEWGPSRYRNLADPSSSTYIDPADRNPDNKYYIEGMRDFFNEVRDSLEFEILFNQIDEVHKLYPEKPWLTQPSRAYRTQFRPNPTARPGGDNPYP